MPHCQSILDNLEGTILNNAYDKTDVYWEQQVTPVEINPAY